MSEWQDIESAPEDLEVLASDGESVATAAQTRPLSWVYSAGGKYVWQGSDERGGIMGLEFSPTHWMPLPTPPSPDKRSS